MVFFIFIADGWGPVSGGINCFNYDLVIACSHATRDNKNIKICCVVPNLTSMQQVEMRKEGIIPITLSKEAFYAPEAIQIISDNIKKDRKLRLYYPDKCNTFCVGHDIYTGSLSKQLAEACDGWNIVFHHMDYSSYYLLAKPNVPIYEEKIEKQKNILRSADLICAVGPMLLQSAEDLSRSREKCIEIFPGLASFDAQSGHPNRFNPIVFGRVEKDNQAIKQIPLAIDAFAKAISMDRDTPIIKNNPTLWVIGYDADNPDTLMKEVRRLQEETAQIAGCMCNIVPRPYINDRSELGEQLRDASVAMMLSFHEGFGLVGYEAIAAGVPLILSENTGLYMFLKREHLDHLVYPVKITGADSSKRYSQNDLNTVASALRNIRQEEEDYKKKAINLRDTLLEKRDKYSWGAVADNFISNVLQHFKVQLKNMSTGFFSPDDITKLSTDLRDGTYTNIIFDPSSGKRVFIAKGENTLASLVACLQKVFDKSHSIFIYNIFDGDDADSVYSDFLSNCWTAFRKKDDIEGPGFEGLLGKRLQNMILILDNFPLEFILSFEKLFSILDKQPYDFYIFVAFQSDCLPQILPYKMKEVLDSHVPPINPKPVPLCLTEEQKLITKILAFRGKTGYSKRLIAYICYGINIYWTSHEKSRCLAGLEEPATIENELERLGLIVEYSEYSYQNTEAYLSAATELEVEHKNYALGLSILGQFYAKCYYRGSGRDLQFSWGYFSCKCFSAAAVMDNEIRNAVKADYEMLLHKIKKRAMDASAYERYFNALNDFFSQYQAPNSLWLWYTFLHCAAIYCPSVDALKKVHYVLKTEFANEENRQGNKLYIQLIRLAAELEDELNICGSLGRFLKRIEALAESNPSGTVWEQCFSTVIILAVGQKDFDLADKYLSRLQKIAKKDELYSQMINLAIMIDLKLSKYAAGVKVDLSNSLSDIRCAFSIAKNKLQDYRAQAWITGLWGECQILLNVENGEGNIRKSMNLRKSSGEKTKAYRNWLQRISKYPLLQQNTKTLLNQEIIRTEILANTKQNNS